MVKKWLVANDLRSISILEASVIATLAARLGADQELEACLEWLEDPSLNVDTYELREARRPRPQSLKSIALQMLSTIEQDAHYLPEITSTIRRALETVDD